MKPILNAKLIKAVDPLDLGNQVLAELKNGRDLYTPLFVSEDGLLCQFVIPMLSIYTYRLIIADDLDDLELQANNLIALDFDFMFSVVLWGGKYLQWMSRMNETGKTVKEALVKTMVPAKRGDELQLVEDVRSVLRMAPVSEDASLISIPFPLPEHAERLGAEWMSRRGLSIPDVLVVGGVVIP